MRRIGRWAVILGFMLALGATAPPILAGDDPAAEAEAFEKGLAACRDCLKRGQAKKGVAKLTALLQAHKERDHARVRRVEIEDLARRLSFRATVKQPDPKGLVTGKLSKWKPSTGEIKISWVGKTSGDLRRSRSSKMVWLPMGIRGPCTLLVEGSPYPKQTADSPRMIFGGDKNKDDDDVSWQITFGTPPHTVGANEVWMPATLTRYEGPNKFEVSEKPITPAKAGKAFKLHLAVTRTSIVAKVNGKSIGKDRKPKEVYGRLGFECRTWRKATFRGQIEPSWIQEKIDKAVQSQRKAFDESYDPKKILPAWLFEAPKATTPQEATPNTPESPDEDLPIALDAKHFRDLRHIYTALGQGDIKEAITAVEGMRTRGAPEVTCAYLLAMIHEMADDTGAALAAAVRVTELEPKFALGWMARARLSRRLGRYAEAVKAYGAGIALHPKRASGYELASVGMLFAGNFPVARKFLQAAAREGVSSKRLSIVGSVIIKAQNGPTFSRVFEHKSRNYHVVSDIGKPMCVEASKVLEQAFTSYRVNFGWVSRDKNRLFKVYLFAGRRGFTQYQVDLRAIMGRPAESAAGLYSGLTKQLLIWNLPTREEMIRTIRHEGFHQYLDRCMPDPPTWLNEGLAVYHEYGKVKGGTLKYGGRISEYVELLAKGGLVPLSEFLFQRHRDFYVGGHHSYAQAWAFLHMLKHGDSKRKKLFGQLVRDFQTDQAPRDVLRRVFSDDLLKQLDRELKAHLAKLIAD